MRRGQKQECKFYGVLLAAVVVVTCLIDALYCMSIG